MIHSFPAPAVNLDHQAQHHSKEEQLVAGVIQWIRPPRHRSPLGKTTPGSDERAGRRDPKMDAKRIDQRGQRAKSETKPPFSRGPKTRHRMAWLQFGLGRAFHETTEKGKSQKP